jgi:hypothetical protein
MPKAMPIPFFCALLLTLAACAAPPQGGKEQIFIESTPLYVDRSSGPIRLPPTVIPPTVVYQPETGCQVLATLKSYLGLGYGGWVQFAYVFQVSPGCYTPPCTCPPAGVAAAFTGASVADYVIRLPGAPDLSAEEAFCPTGCSQDGQLIYPVTLEGRGLYAVTLGEQLLGYLDVPEGVSSSNGPPPEVTRPTGAPTSTLPPGTTYPLPSPPRYVPATPNPLWTLTPTVNPFDYPPPPPGFGPYP